MGKGPIWLFGTFALIATYYFVLIRLRPFSSFDIFPLSRDYFPQSTSYRNADDYLSLRKWHF